MESLDLESDLDQHVVNPEQFLGMVNIDEPEEFPDDPENEGAASIENPNKDDNRRLFQVYKIQFDWDTSIPYSLQPNRLEQEGPIPLKFPDHFLEVEGGVSLIYWQEDKSNGCLATIKDVDEKEETFTFQVHSWQRKKKNTFFDTGKYMIAKECLVWRLIWRTEFELEKKAQDIMKGQTIRVLLRGEISDFTCYVKNLDSDLATVVQTAGLNEGREREFHLSRVVSVVEILSSPLFYRLQRRVAGERIKNGQNLVWESVASENEPNDSADEDVKKPRMLLQAPEGCKYKRS